MRILLADRDPEDYAGLLQAALPHAELVMAEEAGVAAQAADCTVWLGQPDLLAGLLRSGGRPQWLQSTWAGITPLLASDLPRDY
ncbi:D-2-hydroxyacid dehydrogenase, partial [Escherichia coli]|nr:D-2-hydroxyacid dehydrogenase [Escherichia coli]